MNYSYEYRDGSCYLVCTLTNEVVNNYVFYMLMNNNVSNVIRPIYEQGEDGYERLVYCLKGMCSLSDYITYYCSRDEINLLCDGIKKAWSEIDEYMLDERYCIWDFNYVYVDCITGEPYVICMATDAYMGEPLDRAAYLNCIAEHIGAQERNDDILMDWDSEIYEDVLDEPYHETKKWVSKAEAGMQRSKRKKDNRKNTKEKSGRRKAKVVKVVRVKKEMPCYIIPTS